MAESRDQILAEHASDVAATVSSIMSRAETRALRLRFMHRLDRLARVDAECASLLRRGL